MTRNGSPRTLKSCCPGIRGILRNARVNKEIAQTELATGVLESLQQETADGLTLEGILGTDAPEEALVERIALREAIDRLPEKERMAILLRYFKGLTQQQTSRILGVSQVQVSRLERKGLQRLRESFEV